MNTEIWISHNFRVSQNNILFFQSFKNEKEKKMSILFSKIVNIKYSAW